MELEKLLTLNEMAEQLNVKQSWLKAMIFRNEIPFIKIGKHIRFSPKEIQKWIEDRKIQEDSWN
jgi:excisionase family DNA binding protein